MGQGDETWRRVRSVFDRAAGASAEERVHVLAGEPDEVRREVERLLELDGRASAFPEHAAERGGEQALGAALAGLRPGQRVGPYLVVRPIGHGGMGVVFEAEQERPRRRVALKTVRPELATEELLRRFHNEVQLLGQLEHPGIARIYDAGTFGQAGGECPYYAMELVEGARTMLAFAEEERLDRRAQLELFREVCAAVDYGHRKGVIHRDLKPGNVLVDASGRVKVIDFGLARPRDPELLGVSAVETRRGDIFGTLPYMSPEHVSGRSFAIDTQSDVYSLGCILCELLTGRPPRDLTSSGLREALHRIESEEPRIPQGLDRELGWIVLRATAREPARRYPGVAELSADVGRFLRREPLAAGPPSRWYAMRSFVRRYRAPLTTTAAVVVALSIGLVRAERSARAAERERASAEFEARVSRSVNWFLRGLTTSLNAYRQGADARVGDMLEVGDRDLATVDDPAVRAILTGFVGEGFLNSGELERAGDRLRKAVALADDQLEPRSPYRLHIQVLWADWLEQTGRLQESRALSLALRPTLAEVLGPTHEATLYLEMNLAICHEKLGESAAAEAIYRDLLPVAIERDGESSFAVANLLLRLASTAEARGRVEEARELLEEALAMEVELHGEQSLLASTICMGLAGIARRAGDLAGAEALLRDALENYERSGGTRSNRLDVRLRLTRVLFDQGNWDAGAGRLEEVDRLLSQETGTHRHHVGRAILTAHLLWERGEHEAARAAAREAVGLAERVYGVGAPSVAECREQLERVLGS